ncbi:MAG: hypothetical protein ACPLRM_08610, partial [Anaerolineae bacterium]
AAPSPVVNANWSIEIDPTNNNEINPADEGDTHTITIYTKINGTLADPGFTVLVAVGDGTSIITDPVFNTTANADTGVFTCDIVYNTDVSEPGTYEIFAYIDMDSSESLSAADIVSDPHTKTWEDRVATSFTVEPEEATNDVDETHTITVSVFDQWGDPINPPNAQDDVEGAVIAGPNEGTELTVSGTPSTGVYTLSYECGDLSGSTPPFVDTIEITVGDLEPQTVYKTWTYEPELETCEIDPELAYNYVGQEHTVTVYFWDQYGFPLICDATLDFTVEGANPTEETVSGEGVSQLSFSYVGESAGTDAITVSGTVNEESIGTLTATKVWAYEWSVEPFAAVNVIGTPHTFTLKGAPGDLFQFRFSALDPNTFDLDSLYLKVSPIILIDGLQGISLPYISGYWVPVTANPIWTGEIGEDG